MTRYVLPYPDVERPTTPRHQEIQAIRRALSLVAARLTQRPERVEWAVRELGVELERLRALCNKPKTL